jgi:hypothetical protein
MKWLIAILILAIVLIAGCTQTVSNIGAQAGVGITSIGDIVKNPENYDNKSVNVQGTFLMTYLEDNQGYQLQLENCSEPQRDLMIGSTYKAKGIIKLREYGECDYKYSDIEANCTQIIMKCRGWGIGINCVNSNWSNGGWVNEFFTVDGKNVTVENFLTNLSSDINLVDTRWTKRDYFEKKLVSDCPINKEFYECSYDLYDFDAEQHIVTEKIGSVNGTVYKEYRINPDSIEKNIIIECTEPMVKIS